MLKRVKERISKKAFIKYYHEASEQYKKKRNQYLYPRKLLLNIIMKQVSNIRKNGINI